MIRHRKADPSPLPMPRRKSWYAATVVLASCSIVLAPWWIGNHHMAWERRPPSWSWSPLPDPLNQWIGGLGLLLAGGNTEQVWGVRAAYLLLLGLTLWAWRRAMLHRSAFGPGAVQVEDLVAGAETDGPPDRLIADLTARFRKQLSETELYAPTNLPAETSGESFLDLLGDVDLEPQKLATSLLRFISRLRPRLAYRVGGVLMARDREPRYGITVTLTSYALRGSRAWTFWEQSWEQAVCKAAYAVISALLPITRASSRQPWRDWRGRDVPLDLYMAYQKARELSRERKFDEILDCYYQAVRQDPLNVHLRNQIGTAQEKLGLHLDALETYFGVINASGRGTKVDDRRLTLSLWNPRRFTYMWNLRNRPGILQARFRFAVVLGTSEQTAKQWCKTGADARSTARNEIRDALTPAFAKRYREVVRDLTSAQDEDLATPKGAEKWLNDQLQVKNESVEERKKRQKTIARVFRRVAFLELCKLIEDYPLGRFLLRFHSDETALSRSALRVNRDVWASLRLAQTEDGEESEHLLAWAPRQPWHWWWRPGVKRAAVKAARNPHNAESLKRQLGKALRYSRLSPREWLRPREWQGHYNAACVYAVALKGLPHEQKKSDGQVRRDLAEAACHELKEALRRAEGGYMSLRRSWLLYEDPDLAVLRSTTDFVRFAREFYPHPTPDVLPLGAGLQTAEVQEPVGVDETELEATDVEMTAYDSLFLEAVGKAMERVWRHRAAKTAADLHTVSRWFEDEQQIWQLIDVIAASQARNWRNRRLLLHKVEQTADVTVRPRIELPSAVPEFDDVVPLDLESSEWLNPEQTRRARDELPRRFDCKLQRLHEHVGEGSAHSPIRRSRDLLGTVEQLDRSGWAFLHPSTLSAICSRCAGTWQAFSAQFAHPIETEPAVTGFAEALDRLADAVPLVSVGG